MSDVLDYLLKRRSASAKALMDPGPDDAQLETILRAAMRIPDHGRLTPWRFIIIRGENRAAFGKVLGEAYRRAHPDAIEELIEVEEERFLRAPVVVAVTSQVTKGHKIPEWEQMLSSGAACLNMLHATHASGFGAQWITEWPAYDETVKAALGLGPDDNIAGFIYIGSPKEAQAERIRPEYDDIVSEWRPSS